MACFHLPSVTCENCAHLRPDQPYPTTGSRWYFTPSTNQSAPVPTIQAMAKRIMDLEDEVAAKQAKLDLANLERWKAMEAMGLGADDERWRPGETAVDALIRERDVARERASYWSETAEKLGGQLHEAERAAERLCEALDEARDELNGHTCIDCGIVWPRCECPNGQWWRDAGELLKRGGEAE
ncbi:MAG: hypothetical protein EBT03_11680 [Betaproteobacteria bacterium]|nr:hypothetical protein [Betaproteobacteria bacterium]